MGHAPFSLAMSKAATTQPMATARAERDEEGGLTLFLEGRLDASSSARVWREAVRMVEAAPTPRLVVDGSGIDYCDGSGVALLFELGCRRRLAGAAFEIRGLRDDFRRLLEMFDPAEMARCRIPEPKPINLSVEVGRAVVDLWEDFRARVSFLGEVTTALLQAALRPRQVRWKAVFLAAEKAGVNALPIVCLLGFLMGLIMGFQSGNFMKQYAAEVYVANLVGISMIRELGPLITAIILASRSGSAFAAEIGTMKVNEEIDALTTMGLEPTRFLVTPRVIASVVMTPLLTVFANLFGLIGGAIVLLSFGYPLITYVNQIHEAVTLVDLFGGLFKALVYGLIVAQVGCLRGLQTKIGASAVGDSATRAVVTGIVFIAIWDGMFAVIYHYLGI